MSGTCDVQRPCTLFCAEHEVCASTFCADRIITFGRLNKSASECLISQRGAHSGGPYEAWGGLFGCVMCVKKRKMHEERLLSSYISLIQHLCFTLFYKFLEIQMWMGKRSYFLLHVYLSLHFFFNSESETVYYSICALILATLEEIHECPH